MKNTGVKELSDDKADSRTFWSEDGTFGFTEELVSRLMHLAYLGGCKAIEARSYRKGWDDRTEDVCKRLELYTDEVGDE